MTTLKPKEVLLIVFSSTVGSVTSVELSRPERLLTITSNQFGNHIMNALIIASIVSVFIVLIIAGYNCFLKLLKD